VSVTVCWAAKGGSGTTVVTATLALSCSTESLLVDLGGELPAMLGIERPPGQGVADWLASDAPAAALDDLAVPVDRTTRLIPRGSSPVDANAWRWPELLDSLSRRRAVFVDAGTGVPPAGLIGGDARTLLVTRACYLALTKAAALRCRPDGVVLVVEPWRSLGPFDVEHTIGSPVVARVSHDPSVPRAVDAGLLRGPLPRLLRRELRGAA
jgi:MinD-like ATPase involved in chromosome partitioning or flagellar assembly